MEVAEVNTIDAGETTVVLKSEERRKFFRTHSTMSANIDEALKNGELFL